METVNEGGADRVSHGVADPAGNLRWAVALDCGHIRQVIAADYWHPATWTLEKGQTVYCPDHSQGHQLRTAVAYWEPEGFRIVQ